MTEDTDQQGAAGDTDAERERLPEEVVGEAARLTRLARRAVDDGERTACRRERDEMLAEHSYTARIREEDDVLVCYPDEWVEDGTVYPERIDDIDRGVERPLSGPGSGDDWDRIRDHNDDIAREVAAEHGDSHGSNAQYLADFANNHYAKPIEQLTEDELAEFLTEYYPRNTWPTDDQKAVVEESVRLAFDVSDRRNERG